MDSAEVVRRLRAQAAGAALPRGAKLRAVLVNDADALVVAFLRMGGESRPWGIAWGYPHEEPRILTVPEGRNRTLVADMAAEFAPSLIGLLRGAGFVASPPTSREEVTALRQVWLPNDSHLDMLHHLAYAYTFTKWGAGPQGRLNPLGRACGWLHREAQRPGEQHVMVATRLLREAYTFPAQDVRQGHLGYLLAWLRGTGDRRAAAELAEQSPMSTSLDPRLVREEIEPLVDIWNQADRNGEDAEAQRAAASIQAILEPELRRRFDLTVGAIDTLRGDPRPVNDGVAHLVEESLGEQWYQYNRMELKLHDEVDGPAYVPSPETDRHPAAAGSRFFVHEASDDYLETMLLHDDEDLQAEAIRSGDAFRGEIVAARDDTRGRAHFPVWSIIDPVGGLNRIGEGQHVCVIGMPKRVGEVVDIEELADGSRRFDVRLINRKRAIHGADGLLAVDPESAAWIGETIGFTGTSFSGLARRKSSRIWNDDVPGAWLTHARAAGPRSRTVDEARESLQDIEDGMAEL